MATPGAMPLSGNPLKYTKVLIHLDFTVHQRLGVSVFNQTRNVRVYLRTPPPLPHYSCPILRNPTCPTNGYGLVQAWGVKSPSCCKKTLTPFPLCNLPSNPQGPVPRAGGVKFVPNPLAFYYIPRGCTATKQLAPEKSV
jgi:hypothetical protein